MPMLFAFQRLDILYHSVTAMVGAGVSVLLCLGVKSRGHARLAGGKQHAYQYAMLAAPCYQLTATLDSQDVLKRVHASNLLN